MVSKFVQSFNNAIEGLIYVFKTQKNMKVHFVCTVIVLVLSVVLKVRFVDFLFLVFAVSFVLVCEMINTALEMIMDMISESYHPLVRVAKDVSAGAVLISTVGALIIAYLILTKYLSKPVFTGLARVVESPWYMTLIIIMSVIILSIGIKIFLGRGTPFYGGMPSAHTALAFSLWTVVSLLSKNSLVMALTFILAFLVAEGRVASGVHKIREVFLGAVLGFLIAIMIFQLIYRN